LGDIIIINYIDIVFNGRNLGELWEIFGRFGRNNNVRNCDRFIWTLITHSLLGMAINKQKQEVNFLNISDLV
jgi:hypothetical protein